MEVKKVGALGNWASGIGRESGNAGDGMKGTEGGGARWVGRGVWEISDGVLFCVPATRQGCVEKIAAWLISVYIFEAPIIGQQGDQTTQS